MKKSTNLQSKYNHPSENHFLGFQIHKNRKSRVVKNRHSPFVFFVIKTTYRFTSSHSVPDEVSIHYSPA